MSGPESPKLQNVAAIPQNEVFRYHLQTYLNTGGDQRYHNRRKKICVTPCYQRLLSHFTLPAGAQVTIIGSGLARDCYLSAKLSTFGGREAIETCTKALNHEAMSREDRTSTLINRGIIHMRAGDQKSAISDYDRALKMNPDKGEAHLNRGAALIYLQDFAAAKVALDRAIDLEQQRFIRSLL